MSVFLSAHNQYIRLLLVVFLGVKDAFPVIEIETNGSKWF